MLKLTQNEWLTFQTVMTHTINSKNHGDTQIILQTTIQIQMMTIREAAVVVGATIPIPTVAMEAVEMEATVATVATAINIM